MNKIIKFFDFRQNAQSVKEINETMHDNIKISIDNTLILASAIIIASIGLNINSTAAIIGAMLISPIMGPLLTLSYSFVIGDSRLLKKSLSRLGVYVLVALLISTIYFSLTFIKNPTAELVARTNPTIFDILIAIFGGIAGIIGITRKNKTNNVIPGVAIATALMPPLCTIGYGIANFNFTYIFNATVLFITNAYFIVITSTIILYLMRFHKSGDIEGQSEGKIKRIIFALFIVILIPTAVNTYSLISRAALEGKVDAYIYENINNEDIVITNTNIDYTNEVITFTVDGKLKENQKKSLKEFVVNQDSISDFSTVINYEKLESL